MKLPQPIVVCALACGLALGSSCSMLDSTRSKLENMSNAEFVSLNKKVYDASAAGGKLLARQLEKQDRIMLAKEVLAVIRETVVSDNLTHVDDLVRVLLDKFGGEIGSDKVVEFLKDATNLLDVAVGDIKLGIDGKLSFREKSLLVTLLRGIYDGL